jgi:hypothetical protein
MKPMNVTEHLQRIKAKCRVNLAAVMPGQVITPDAMSAKGLF